MNEWNKQNIQVNEWERTNKWERTNQDGQPTSCTISARAETVLILDSDNKLFTKKKCDKKNEWKE